MVVPSTPLAKLFWSLLATTALAAALAVASFWLSARDESENGWVRHIKIYSESGAGTTVKIYLPRLVGEAKEISRTLEMRAKAGDAGEVILVVEDDPLMRKHAIEALTELGYTVLDSEGATDALAILDRTPDIKMLFTDVVMPEMNGRKLADECLRRRPHLKVLFTTGYTPNAVVHGGVLDKGVAFLGKPFTLEQLAAKVSAALDH